MPLAIINEEALEVRRYSYTFIGRRPSSSLLSGKRSTGLDIVAKPQKRDVAIECDLEDCMYSALRSLLVTASRRVVTHFVCSKPDASVLFPPTARSLV